MFKNYSGKLFLAVLLIGCLCMLPAANAATLFEDNFSDGDLCSLGLIYDWGRGRIRE